MILQERKEIESAGCADHQVQRLLNRAWSVPLNLKERGRSKKNKKEDEDCRGAMSPINGDAGVGFGHPRHIGVSCLSKGATMNSPEKMGRGQGTLQNPRSKEKRRGHMPSARSHPQIKRK